MAQLAYTHCVGSLRLAGAWPDSAQTLTEENAGMYSIHNEPDNRRRRPEKREEPRRLSGCAAFAVGLEERSYASASLRARMRMRTNNDGENLLQGFNLSRMVFGSRVDEFNPWVHRACVPDSEAWMVR